MHKLTATPGVVTAATDNLIHRRVRHVALPVLGGHGSPRTGVLPLASVAVAEITCPTVVLCDNVAVIVAAPVPSVVTLAEPR